MPPDTMEPINRPLRLLYTSTGGAEWTGGITYRRNLLKALAHRAADIEVYILGHPQNSEDTWQFVDPSAGNNLANGRLGGLVRRLFGYDAGLRAVARALPEGRADLVFPGQYAVGRDTALLFWIPDFQFMHLPAMYSRAQLQGLERKYRRGLQRASLVVLSSQDAHKDLTNFAPSYADKSRVMHFVAHVPEQLYEADLAALVRTYNLPEKFFYLPNQFWAHKNHIIVFEALKQLQEQGVRPFIVCTGNPTDVRQPMHFAGLMQKISLWGLRDQVAFLGLIPHEDVYALIRQSVCVLNPSLFEGWSTTIEEVKSIGKRVLLSDLAVHREQNPPAGTFFDPHDAADLAQHMTQIWTGCEPGPDLDLEQEARRMLPQRMQHYADTFLSIAREAVGVARRGRSPSKAAALRRSK